jgi:pepsin A
VDASHEEVHEEIAMTSLFAPVSQRLLEMLRADQRKHSTQQTTERNFSTHFTSLKDLSGSEYVGPIGVGTNPLPVNCKGKAFSLTAESKHNKDGDACAEKEESLLSVVFDSGSTNLWIASDLCEHPCNQEGRHRYNHSISTTYKDPPEMTDLNIDFGTANLQGPMGVDNMHIGPFTIRDQHFALIKEENGETFASLPMEGIVGLAFPAMSANGRVPFFDNVIKQKALEHNEFSFYFNKETKNGGNAIFWGGVDPQLYEGDIKMFPVSQPYYWALDLIDFRIGDTPLKVTSSLADKGIVDTLVESSATQRLMDLLGVKTVGDKPSDVPASSSPKLIVDTGTTYFTAAGELYSIIRDKLPDAKCSETKGYPDLVYVLKDVDGKHQELRIPASEYMVSDFGDWCTAAFMQLEVSPRFGPAMLFGEVFMRGYFTVFDRADGHPANAKIGFARSKHSESLNTMLAASPGEFQEKTKHTENVVRTSLEEARTTASKLAEGIANFLTKAK